MLAGAPSVELEVSLESRPSVTVAVLVYQDEMFIPATLRPAEKRWPQAITENPRIRLRYAGTVVDASAHRVRDEVLHRQLSRIGAEKYSPSYFIPEKTWFFRVGASDSS